MAIRRTLAAIALTAVAALSLSACNSGDPATTDPAGTSGAGAGGGELTKITVGSLSIAPSAALQYGVDKGIFTEHGLDVEITLGQGGANLLPAVSNGSINVAVGNPLSVLVAGDKGLDMRIASGYSSSLASGDDINATIVRADSGISSWKDLEGKTVAVNNLNTQGDLTMMEAVEKDGGDPTKVKFTEIAFPDMTAQLELGNVDAIWLPEPFMSKTLGDSANKLLGFPNQVAIPGLPTMVTFTSGSYAQANAETLQKFTDALAATFTAAEADKDGFASTIASFTGMPIEAAKHLRMEKLSTELDPALIQQLADLAKKFDYLTKPADVDTIVLSK